MIIADFTLDHPILRETLAQCPDIELTWEQTYSNPDGSRQLVAWLSVDDFDALDAVLRDDPSVANPTVVTELRGRRLYRLDLADRSLETTIMPVLAEVGAVHERLTASGAGWHNRVRFPNRDGFERLHRFCHDHGIDFTLNRLYERSERFDEGALELTRIQRETLVAAAESGYLEIPRACTLEELADRLGVSQSAASERFRRSVARLIDGTVLRAAPG